MAFACELLHLLEEEVFVGINHFLVATATDLAQVFALFSGFPPSEGGPLPRVPSQLLVGGGVRIALSPFAPH